MKDAASISSPLLQRARLAQSDRFIMKLAKAGYQLSGLLAPGIAGRIAANAFGRSRPKKGRVLFRLPLGARLFNVVGNEDIHYGYLWPAQGPTALLVHGWGSDSSSMLGLVNPLLSLGFQVAAFDAPAHGESTGNKTTMMRFVKAVCAVIESLHDIEVVIAHSLGSIASVSAIADLRHDKMIKRLVLVAAPASLSAVLERWSSNLQLPTVVVDKIYERLRMENGVPVSHWDIGVLGAALEVPILVIHDEQDSVVPLAEAARLARSLKNVRMEKTSGLGHSRILVAPSVKDMIIRFIGKTSQ